MDWDTRQRRLIGKKHLQLCKGPTMECCALRPSSPRPRANMGQIFDRNRPLCAFGLRNNPFGEVVVHPGGKPALLTGQLLQPATTTECALPLELVSQTPMAIAHVLDCLPRKDFPIAIDRDIRHAQIETENIFHVDWLRCFNVASGKQVPVATHKGQVGFAASSRKQRPLTLTTHKGNGLTLIKSPDRDGSIGHGKRENAFVVGDCSQRSKRTLCLAIQLIGICDFGDTAHRQLGREPEGLAHIAIGEPVNWELTKGACGPGDLADEIAGSVSPLKRALEGISLFRRREEFQLNGQSHATNIAQGERLCQRLSSTSGRRNIRRSSIPLPPKVGCFLEFF